MAVRIDPLGRRLLEGHEAGLHARAVLLETDGPGLRRGPQPPVVQRRPLLHPARLLQQRADLSRRLDPLHPAHLAGQLELLAGPVVAIEVGQHAAAQVDALADVEQRVTLAVEQVHAGRLRQLFGQVRIELWRQPGRLDQFLNGRIHLLRIPVLPPQEQQVGQHPRVAERPVTGAAGQAVPFHHGVQPVAAQRRVHAPRQPDRAQHRRAQPQAGAAELVAQEAVVEARVVRDEQAPLEPGHHLARQVPEGRRVGDHLVGDAGELLDARRHPAPRVDERAPLLHHAAAVHQHDAHLDHPVVGRTAAGRLQVDAGEGTFEQWRHQARGSPSESNGP